MSVPNSHCSVSIVGEDYRNMYSKKWPLVHLMHFACWDNLTWLSHRQCPLNVPFHRQLNLIFYEEVVDSLVVSSSSFSLFKCGVISYALISLLRRHYVLIILSNLHTEIFCIFKCREASPSFYKWEYSIDGSNCSHRNIRLKQVIAIPGDKPIPQGSFLLPLLSFPSHHWDSREN